MGAEHLHLFQRIVPLLHQFPDLLGSFLQLAIQLLQIFLLPALVLSQKVHHIFFAKTAQKGSMKITILHGFPLFPFGKYNKLFM